nr:uncharacterized protein LOC113824064 isoform X1 [Penaeus vannamei]
MPRLSDLLLSESCKKSCKVYIFYMILRLRRALGTRVESRTAHFIHRTSLTRIPENGVRLRRKEAHRGTSASPDLRVPRFLPLRLRVYPDGARLRAHGLLPDGHDPEHGRDGFPRPDCARHWHDHAPGVHLLLLIRQH